MGRDFLYIANEHTLIYIYIYCSLSSYISVKIRERINRAVHQRLYMVDVSPQTIHEEYGGPSIKLNVLGSTGNVYEVTICKVPTCSCPDAMKVCLSFVVF